MTIFDTSFGYVIGVEGTLSLDPKDDGNWTGGNEGAGLLKGTKYGISAAAYPTLDIPNLTLEQARAIYWSDFWLPAGCSNYPSSVALEMFDCAVNQGVIMSKRILQEALGVKVDGIIGSVTMAALRLANQRDFANAFRMARIVHYQRDEDWNEYGNGWVNRANQTCTQACALI